MARRLAILILQFALLAPLSSPALGKNQARLLSNLLKRCEDGIAVSCFEYGKILAAERDSTSQKKGAFYIRRACTLAYSPACQKRSNSMESKAVKESPSQVQISGPCSHAELAKSIQLKSDGRSIASISPGSMWEQWGLKEGDSLTQINGQAYSGPDQVSRSFENGFPVLNIVRGGQETSLVLACPRK